MSAVNPNRTAAPSCIVAPTWYVVDGRDLVGPFSAEEVRRFVLLGRVGLSDRVTSDGLTFEPVTQVPELVPDALLDIESVPTWARAEQPQEPVPADWDNRQMAHAVLAVVWALWVGSCALHLLDAVRAGTAS